VESIGQTGEKVQQYARSLGAELYGVAAAEALREHFPDKPQPERFVPGAKSVIVLGLPFSQGVMATVARPELSGLQQRASKAVTNVVGRVQGAERFFSGVENNMLDHELTLMAYKLARSIERRGFQAMYLPPSKGDNRFRTAPFYHMPAMYLAGLGTMGLNCSVLTPEFGPRVWVTSVITDLALPAGQPMAEELCTECQLCVENCPVHALDGQGWKDVHRCAAYGCCGTCQSICPVGKDVKV
jgi:epoxyqueuosine reductase QueG